MQDKFLPREIAIVREIRHEAIVRHHAVFDLGAKVYILMDLAPNGDLLDYIRHNQFVMESHARSMFKRVSYFLFFYDHLFFYPWEIVEISVLH